MIVDPVTMSPDDKVSDALEVMRKYKISGVPITKAGRLVGILTNRDLRFESRFDVPISKVMTKENLITVPVGTTLAEAERSLVLAQFKTSSSAARQTRPDSCWGQVRDVSSTHSPSVWP